MNKTTYKVINVNRHESHYRSCNTWKNNIENKCINIVIDVILLTIIYKPLLFINKQSNVNDT